MSLNKMEKHQVSKFDSLPLNLSFSLLPLTKNNISYNFLMQLIWTLKDYCKKAKIYACTSEHYTLSVAYIHTI